MPDTNDTLGQTTAAATPVTETKAEGNELSNSTQQTASQETPEKLFAGKYRTVEDLEKGYQEAQRALSTRSKATEVARDLGLTKQSSATEVKQVAAQTTGAEARQIAQQAGGDQLDTWYQQAKAKYGETAAIQALIKHVAQNAIAEVMAPVNNKLQASEERTNQQAVVLATQQLLDEYPDAGDMKDAFKAYWDANPKKRDALMDQRTTEEDKYDLLETAYLKLAKAKAKNSTAAAKTAGAVESKRQEEMKATTVTAGSGAGKRNDTPPNKADTWAEAAKEYTRSSDPFK